MKAGKVLQIVLVLTLLLAQVTSIVSAAPKEINPAFTFGPEEKTRQVLYVGENILFINTEQPSGVYANDEAGNFTWVQDLSPAYDAIVGDFDNDGDKDDVFLVTTGIDEVWLNNEGGFTRSLTATSTLLDEPGTVGCALDYDGDGDQDVLVGYNSGITRLISNDTDGFYYRSHNLPANVLIYLDGDGDQELVVGTSDGAFIYDGNGEGNFTLTQQLHSGSAIYGIAENQNLLVISGDNYIGIFSNNGGTFTVTQEITGTFSAKQSYWVNENGQTYLVVIMGDNQADQVYTNNGGIFSLATLLHGEGLDNNRRAACFDINNDGWVDCVTASYGIDTEKSVYRGPLVNISPVANSDAYTVTEDSSDNSLNVLGNDTDANGDGLNVSAVGVSSEGGKIINRIDTITYTTMADFFGTDTFTYTVTDSNGGFNTATVTITVTNVNDAPVAVNDETAVKKDSTDNPISILDNDTDIDDDQLIIATVGIPNQGGTTINAGKSITYTPAANFSGQDVFTYTVSDDFGGFDTAMVTITVAESICYLSYGTIGGGVVVPSPDMSLRYPCGTEVTLTATPNIGWYFDGWSGNVVTTTNPLTTTMNADKYFFATFKKLPAYTLDFNVVGNGSVTKVPSATTFISGTTVQLTAIPDKDSVFIDWNGNASGAMTTTTVLMDANKVVTATFAEMFTLEFAAVGDGAVTLDPPGGVYTSGMQVTLTAVPSTTWFFAGWNGDLDTVNPTETLTMDTDKTVTATFTQEPPVTYTLTISVTGEGSGVVTPTIGARVYVSGTLVTLGATPAPGSVFVGWSGDLSSANSAETLTMDTDKAVTATFALKEWRIYMPLILR